MGMVLLVATLATLINSPWVDGISFADDPTIYVPIRELCADLGMRVGFDGRAVTMDGAIPEGQRSLVSGTRIAPIRAVAAHGVRLDWDEAADVATLTRGDMSVTVVRGVKRVRIDKGRQLLEAYQGDRLVLATPVSTGRQGHLTPNGEFVAGPAKHRMHYSSLYDFSPMPWSVQVDGHIFIHGYESVPDVPASHGCIRLPLSGANPARWFFEWVDIGTPITIEGQWQASRA